MTLRGSVLTANAGLPEADAMQVFVHMHIHTLKYTHTGHTHVIVFFCLVGDLSKSLARVIDPGCFGVSL